jgi:hypothetical protein
LNLLLIEKLGVIDETHNIDWAKYKNSLIIKHFNKKTKMTELIINKIEKVTITKIWENKNEI